MVRRLTFGALAVLMLRAGEILVELASHDGEPVPGNLRYRALRFGRYLRDLVNSGVVDGKPR